MRVLNSKPTDLVSQQDKYYEMLANLYCDKKKVTNFQGEND